MAVRDLNSFTLHAVTTGLLLTCLLFFAISFIYSNNPNGLGDETQFVFENASGDNYASLIETPSDSNVLLNITSNTNPEVSDLGSRDSVSTSYSATGTAKNSFKNSRILISWVFSGTSGKLLLGVFSGIIGLLAYFFIYKHIRQGN